MENPSRLSILEDLMKSQENLIKKNQITDQKIDKIALAFDELSKYISAQGQNKPVQAINISEIEISLSNQLKASLNPISESFKGVSDRIDNIPKKIDTNINWITFVLKGWKLYIFWTVMTLSIAVFANYKLISLYNEATNWVQYHKQQIKKLKDKNPETAKKYFPNE